MMSIEEYAKKLNVKIITVDGDFYVSLRDYERLLKKLKEIEEEK